MIGYINEKKRIKVCGAVSSGLNADTREICGVVVKGE